MHLSPITYSYSIDDEDENKKGRGIQKCVTKQKLKFEDYKNRLEANQLPRNRNVEVDSLRESHKEFIKSIRLILKTQQKFGNEKHNVFTEKAHEIVLRTVIETNAYGTSKDIIRKNNQIIYNNIIN